MVGELVLRFGRCQEFIAIVGSVFELQTCVMDEQRIADEIIKAARMEEGMVGFVYSAPAWRSAARALHELHLRGPCLKGDGLSSSPSSSSSGGGG